MQLNRGFDAASSGRSVKYDTVLNQLKKSPILGLPLSLTDEEGNIAHFFNEPVIFKAEGNIEIIGEETVGFKGGLCGVYVRTKEGPGTGILTVSNKQTGTQTVEFSVVKDTVKEI